MSCSCETYSICVGGQTYQAHIMHGPRGSFLSGYYLDNNLALQNLTPGSFTFGACATTSQPDTEKVTQALNAGNTVIPHAFGIAPGEVEVRSAADGSIITARVVGRSATNITLFTPVAFSPALIVIDV